LYTTYLSLARVVANTPSPRASVLMTNIGFAASTFTTSARCDVSSRPLAVMKVNSTLRPHDSYTCASAAHVSRTTALTVGFAPVARLIDPVSLVAPVPFDCGQGSTTTTLIALLVTPRDVAPPLFFGAGATQYGPPVVVTIGNEPHPWIATALH